METTQEKAWEENFRRDINKMAKEILVNLNKDKSLGMQVELKSSFAEDNLIVSERERNYYIKIILSSNVSDPNPNHYKYFISLVIFKEGKFGSSRESSFSISKNLEYTKKELNVVKTQILERIHKYSKW